MLYDANSGAASPVMIEKGHDGGAMGGMWMGFMWPIFALVLIFLALVFLWGRRDGDRTHGNAGLDSVAPILAASIAAKGNYGHDGGYAHGYNYMMAHDGMRDNLREFAHVREEIKDTAYTQSRESDKYFFETNRNIDNTKYEGYKATKESEERILLRIADAERRAEEREERKLREEVAYLRNRDMFFSFRSGNVANIQQIDTAGHGYGYC